jgi:dihydroorotase
VALPDPIRSPSGSTIMHDMPIIVHITHPPPSIEEFLPLLLAGDIITHWFTGLPMSLFDDDRRLIEAARRAIDAGVILDIGHGAGPSFSEPLKTSSSRPPQAWRRPVR